MTYAGLTISDKPALIAAQNAELGICFLWSIGKAVNVKEALAQIAEMESELTANSTPMTWNERINQMTVEEKAESIVNGLLDEFWAKSIDDTFMSDPKSDEEYHALRKAMWIKFLASPYTEGETK